MDDGNREREAGVGRHKRGNPTHFFASAPSPPRRCPSPHPLISVVFFYFFFFGHLLIKLSRRSSISPCRIRMNGRGWAGFLLLLLPLLPSSSFSSSLVFFFVVLFRNDTRAGTRLLGRAALKRGSMEKKGERKERWGGRKRKKLVPPPPPPPPELCRSKSQATMGGRRLKPLVGCLVGLF